MKIEVEGIEELYEKIRSIKGKLSAFGTGSIGPAGEYAQQLGSLAEDARDRVAELTPKSPEGGRHARAWKISRVGRGKGRGAIVRVYNRLENEDPPILMYLEFGTRPHLILPIRAQYLVFEIDGKFVATKYVVHPGTTPYAMVAITREEFAPKMAELAEKWSNDLERIWREGL